MATKLWTMERDTDAAASSQSTQSHRRQRIVNVKYQGDCMREDPLAIGWPDHMPAHGILEMDYVTHEGAPAGLSSSPPMTLRAFAGGSLTRWPRRRSAIA